MNYLDLYSSYPDRTIVAAWDSQIKEANKAPWIAETLNHLDRELFSHFAVYYAQLCALPRGARRSLQRKLARSSELAAVLPTYLQQSGRRFQHRMAWSLAGAALLLALGQGAAVAATINVTTSNPNIVADGQCSLIEAIINANNDAATHADCAAGSGADTIVLPPNANVTLTNAYSNTFGATGLPPIASSITIQGNGTMIARQGNAPEFRIITIASLGNLKLQQMTLTGGLASSGGGIRNDGTLTIENTTISGNTTGITGGGVLNSGTLSINNSILSGNVAQYGGAGLINYGTLTIENSTISSNVASYPGGGIRNFGNLTIGNSTISGNTGYFSGGGVVNYGAGILVIENSIISGNIIAGPYFNSGGGVSNFGSLTLQNSTISINTAERGGGLLNSGKVSVKSSSISGNTAVNGGGLTNYGSLTIENSVISGNTANKGGGGVYSFGNLTITNSTISGNTANVGGGLRNTAHCYFGCSSASLTVENSTISGNHANQGGGVSNALVCYYGCPPTPTPATLTFNRSLIAGNEASVAPEIDNQSTNIVNANNFNLFGTSGNAGVSGFTPGPKDIVPSVSLAQILGPLANNGGLSQTHALVPGSPAIDAGDPGGCRDSQGKLLVTEQRGFARHADGNNDGTIRCDIGAFEFGAEFVPIPPSPLALGATTLATSEIGAAFSSDLMISGGVGSYVVSIIKGKLPAGLSVDNDGVISGTPSTNARSEKVSVRITDSVTGESITQTFTITVLNALRIAGNLRTGRVGKAYSDSLKPRGGLGPFNWNITSGAVPGLSFNNATGALTGTPTQAGEFPLTVQVADVLGGIAVESLTLRIR